MPTILDSLVTSNALIYFHFTSVKARHANDLLSFPAMSCGSKKASSCTPVLFTETKEGRFPVFQELAGILLIGQLDSILNVKMTCNLEYLSLICESRSFQTEGI